MTKQELENLIKNRKSKRKFILLQNQERLNSLIELMKEDLEMASMLIKENINPSEKIYEYSFLIGTDNNKSDNEPLKNVLSFNRNKPRDKENEIAFNPFQPEKGFFYYFIPEDQEDIHLLGNKKTYTDITTQFIKNFCDDYEDWHKAFHEWLERIKNKEF